MRVRVRFFAGTRDAVGASSLDVDVAQGARVADLVDALVARHPRLAPYRPHALVAVDGAFVAPAAPLREGAEVAFMPPVSGGSLDDVALHPEPFSLDALVEALERRGTGAVVGFLGCVRDTSPHAPAARIARLQFEAYDPMATAELQRVRSEACAKFGLTGCLIRHRVGALEAGEPIVAVVTASAHRRAAFEAAMWIMDELKTRVPIWKQEVAEDGATRWVNDPTTRNPHA